MRIPTDQKKALCLRFRERRWLAAASAIVLLGLALTSAAADVRPWALTALYVLPFYGVHGLWLRRRFEGDPALLPLLHLITGIGLMLMLGIEDGWRSHVPGYVVGWQSLAGGYAIGCALGCVVVAAASLVDTRRTFWRRQHGIWLVAGLAIALVLFAAGSGPSGSGARVNLEIPYLGRVQPVEVVKLCLLVFLAGYFARNWTFLRELRERRALPRLLRRIDVPRIRDVVPVTAGVALTLGSCFLLRDMGPALVMGCSFLILYGTARGRWLAPAAGFAAMLGGFWLIYSTGAVPVVADRMSMLLSPWDNFVRGGEHLAHAYWAMASGGIWGTGPGLGSAGNIPASHTDMVVPVVGEQFGLIGLLTLLLLYVTLLARILRIGRRAAGPFGLFLSVGAGLMLLFQLFLIAGGTTGLAPLSGVVTPFLSYGKSSMLVNCMLIGLLASISSQQPTPLQKQTCKRHFSVPLRVALAVAVLLPAAVAVRAVLVQAVYGEEWVIKPALVPKEGGRRAYTYNPRIFDARKMLGRGTIFDRNGTVLAADSRSDSSSRRYPVGAAAFHLLGDVDRRVKWGATNSLYAEYRYLSYLRGYDNHPIPVIVDGRPTVLYDYTELRPLLGWRRFTRAAADLMERNRDIYLTVDARLQKRTVEVLKEMAPEGKTASVVVLDVATGEVLSSVTYPLLDFDHPSEAHRDPDVFDRGYGEGAKPPGSTFKLVTAIAALEREPDALHWSRIVRASDRYARRGEPTGTADMRRAIVSSSNVYFAALAREIVGAEKLLATLEGFGFRAGSPGLSYRDKIDLLLAPDNLRQAGFGQGPIVGGPLQVAHVAAAIANDGVRVPIRWVKTPARLPARSARSVSASDDTKALPASAHDAGSALPASASVDRRPSLASIGRGPVSPERGSASAGQGSASAVRGPASEASGSAGSSGTPLDAPVRVLSSENARALASYMRGVITEPRGTAKSLQASPVPIAGKTGTAEEDHGLVNHAWFTGFAPYYETGSGSRDHVSRRRIAVGVLVEEGGSGGVVAAPIARAIIEEAAALGIIDAGVTASDSTMDQSTLGPTTLISSSHR